MIRLLAPDTPRGEPPLLGVVPGDHVDASPEERDRIADEAGCAAMLVGEANDQQLALLQRLARLSPAGELRFAFVATLERFLAATAALDAAAAAAVSDDEVHVLWHDAESGMGADPRGGG